MIARYEKVLLTRITYHFRKLIRTSLFSYLNKPDRATLRPDCVFACIDHVTYMERQMDKKAG